MNRWPKLISLAAFAGLVVALLPSVALAQSPADRGEALLRTNCAGCHAVGKTGASPHAAAPPFRTLGASFDLDSLERRLTQGIVAGHPDMPEFKLGDDDAHAAIVYLRSIQK